MSKSLLRNPRLQIIFAVTLTGVMGVSSITPILPEISNVFSVTPNQASLLIIVFTMPGIVLTPIFGILADLYGRRRVLAPVLFLFGTAGTLCFWAPDFETLMYLRFAQGIGAASLGAMNVTIISDLFSGNQRTTALGYNSAVLSFGATLYPAIGGSLALIGWRYPFLLPFLAFPTGVLVIVGLKPFKRATSVNYSIYFSGVYTALKSRKIRTMFLLSTSTFLLLYGPILTFLPFYMEHYFDSDALTIGIVLASISIGNLFSGATLGRLTKKYTSVQLLLVSYLLYSIALIVIPAMGSEILLVIPCIVFGMAIGINNPNVQTLIAKTVRPEQRAAILSINGMVLRLGQTIGPLIMATFFAIGGYVVSYIMAGFVALGIYFFLRSRVKR